MIKFKLKKDWVEVKKNDWVKLEKNVELTLKTAGLRLKIGLI